MSEAGENSDGMMFAPKEQTGHQDGEVLSFLREATEDVPRRVLETLADTKAFDKVKGFLMGGSKKTAEGTTNKLPVSEVTEHVPPRELERNGFLQGNMPIVAENEAISKILQEQIYGEVIGSGKWSYVLDAGEDRVAKIFVHPENIHSCYEFEFMHRYGGKAGLPEFIGATVNGYVMEKIEGKTLKYLIDSATYGLEPDRIMDAIKNIMSKDQAQQLLYTVAEYHWTTGRVHGDLANYKNIIIEESGGVRIIDTGWERVGSQTPELELSNLHLWLTDNVGIEGLTIPTTISNEESILGIQRFKDEVEQQLIIDPAFNHVVGFKTDVPNVVVDIEAQKILVSELAG